MTSLNTTLASEDTEFFQLLGTTLIAIQKVEFSLYTAIQSLSKNCQQKDIQAITRVPSNAFLKGTTTELKPALNLLQQQFSDELPLSLKELEELIYKRNLVTNDFWQVTGSDQLGVEKIAQPIIFLQTLIGQCESWTAELETVSAIG
ncbi:hypothetical protein NM22_13905 [Vibrio tubiashii]|nr:hypothetical protein NM22_13905 [Vibrio tubiashii]